MTGWTICLSESSGPIRFITASLDRTLQHEDSYSCKGWPCCFQCCLLFLLLLLMQKCHPDLIKLLHLLHHKRISLAAATLTIISCVLLHFLLLLLRLATRNYFLVLSWLKGSWLVIELCSCCAGLQTLVWSYLLGDVVDKKRKKIFFWKRFKICYFISL